LACGIDYAANFSLFFHKTHIPIIRSSVTIVNMNLNIRRGAEPYFFPGKRVGCLVLHGLTASPQETYWLGADLAAAGFTVCGPRYFAHGVQSNYMNRAHWQDWYFSALDGYHMLARHCDRIVVLGLSMGGLFSLMLGSEMPVAGIVPIAAPLWLPLGRMEWTLLKILRRLGVVVNRYASEEVILDGHIRETQSLRKEAVTGRVAYGEHTAAGVDELLKLQVEVTARLAKITAPVYLIFSENDATVPLENAERIKVGLTNSREVSSLIVRRSGHILTNDIDSEEVIGAAITFVKRVTFKETFETKLK
jgi:carboxylesterase